MILLEVILQAWMIHVSVEAKTFQTSIVPEKANNYRINVIHEKENTFRGFYEPLKEETYRMTRESVEPKGIPIIRNLVNAETFQETDDEGRVVYNKVFFKT